MAAPKGHNSKKSTSAQGVAGQELLSFLQRIERLEEEKKELAADISEVYAEVKAVGFDAKIVRKIVALRRRDRAERQEEEALIDTYLHAIGEVE